jgi:hypothetical protein
VFDSTLGVVQSPLQFNVVGLAFSDGCQHFAGFVTGIVSFVE